jgi:ribonuclease E
MAKKMLIDASHTEETRVAIVDGKRVEEFDFESTTKKQLKGNIYLAKVVRIEPSLQAAFVEFGGNLHGFLPFSEIHPDYYRIPMEDREKILQEQAELNKKLQAEDDGPVIDHDKDIEVPDEPEDSKSTDVDQPIDEESTPLKSIDAPGVLDFSPGAALVEFASPPVTAKMPTESQPFIPLHRRYKIQEVIKRRQIMLIQVNKEERGGKGAALTTYLSIPGRYGVIMPNSTNSGGISRKITNVADRKRLRSLISDIDLPDTMSLIIRTAGMSRTKPEIKRDCDYLVRLWNDIRELTLKSEAPALIYGEGGLIKRSIRDYYDKDIDEVLVEGELGYEYAVGFMKQLMPTHVKRVKEFKSQGESLFQKYGVEEQLSAIHTPTVRLKSGGYIVFGTTEALVAIDVNSGKATKERHIDETAFKTNLEAADEVAYQLRLRDLAGLVVIDFIDMEDPRHNEAVEKRLRDAMRQDRARVQVGWISNFGLLELSRQRLRPNIMEATSIQCRHCAGTGMMRSDSSVALQVLRSIEEEVSSHKGSELTVYMPIDVALYIMNEKRSQMESIESQSGVKVILKHDPNLIIPEYRIEKDGVQRGSGQRRSTQEVISHEDSKIAQEPSRRGRRGPYGKGRGQGRRDGKPNQGEDSSLPEASKSLDQIDNSGNNQDAESSGNELNNDQKSSRRRGGRRRPQRRRQGQGQGQHQPDNQGQTDNNHPKPAEKPVVSSKSLDPIDKGKANMSPPSSQPVVVQGQSEEKKKATGKSWIKRLLE